MFGYNYLKTSDYKSKQMAKNANTEKKVDKKPMKESKSKTEKVPVTKTEKVPVTKTEKVPVTKTEKVPVTKTEKVPVTKTEKVPVKKNVKVSEPEDKVEEVEETESSEVEGSSESKKRRVPTKDSIIEGFDELVAAIDEEISRLRESSGKAKGVKFLRSLGKKVKTLQGQSVRVMKQKQKTNRKNNTNSGFLKPVHISSDMAKFTGWNHDELKSRVDVTKYICKYIRDNNLQNPEDRRQIIADKKLAKLLDFNPEKDDKPLTYYRIQTYMKKHFTNPPKVDA